MFDKDKHFLISRGDTKLSLVQITLTPSCYLNQTLLLMPENTRDVTGQRHAPFQTSPGMFAAHGKAHHSQLHLTSLMFDGASSHLKHFDEAQLEAF